MKIPSIHEVNKTLKTMYPEQNLFIEQAPLKYLRGKLNTVWVNVICSKHGPCPKPKRWLDIQYGKGSCQKCTSIRLGKERRLTNEEIKKRIAKNVKNFNLHITIKNISYPNIDLVCKLHGEYTTTIDKAINRSQLCPECGFGRCSTANMTSIDDKRQKFLKRYPDSSLKILSQLPKNKLEIWCNDCDYIFEAKWGNIYSGGTGCPNCIEAGQIGYNKPYTVKEITEKLAEQGLTLLGQYVGTHTKCKIECENCGTRKLIKPNEVFFGKGSFSCKCTQSIPNYCRDLIACDLRLTDRLLIKECREFDYFIPDIVLPSLRIIVEVKYGESCFGKKDGSKHERDRNAHVCKQYRCYKKTGYRIIYLIVAFKDDLRSKPLFLDDCEHYDIETLEKFELAGLSAIKKKTIETLTALYETPVTVRGINFFDNPEYRYFREKLFSYLNENDHVYPAQGKIPQLFGVSSRYIDRALGLGRKVNNRHRIKILKEVFGIKARAERKFYKSQ